MQRYTFHVISKRSRSTIFFFEGQDGDRGQVRVPKGNKVQRISGH